MNKAQLILVTCMLTLTSAKAQTSFQENLPLHISYFGQYGLHPGFKIGTHFDLLNWEKQKDRKKRSITKYKSLFVSPQIGFYIHPKNHLGLSINADFGYKRLHSRFNFYSAYSIGLGALTQFNAGTTYVFDESGEVSQKAFASRTYLLSTINYEFGQQVTPVFGWFGKISFGVKAPYNTGISLENFMEVGVKLNLGKLNQEKTGL